MSKYIKLDTAIEHTNQLYHGDEVEAWLESLPTIEVSENNQVLYGNEHNCVLTMFGECSYNEAGCGSCAVAEKIRKALSAEVSEDAISREVAMDIVVSSTAEEMVEKMRNAPSVIPQEKEGEWVKVDDSVQPICSKCGMSCSGIHRNADYSVKPNWNYCPNCGAKMKGAENE